MSRQTWNRETGEWEPSDVYYARKARKRIGMVLPDITEFVSPINCELITSRPQLREHEKRHQVRQCGELKQASDYNLRGEDWKPPSQQRGYWGE